MHTASTSDLGAGPLRPPPAGVADSPRAWLMAAAAFVVGFVVFGTMYSFGVFFRPMAEEFRASGAAISAFFAVTGLVFYVIGPITGHLGDRLGPRIMVGVGAAVMGASLVLTAFIDRLWVGYVTYGVGTGVGAACAYFPALAIIGGWFDRQRGMALGVAAAGTGCGMLIAPPLAAVSIGQFGWRGTDVIFGVVSAVLLAGCAAATRPPVLDAGAAHRPLGRIVRSFEFVMLYASWILATTALFVPFVYLPAFALDHGASEVAASTLLSVIGGMSVLGRLGIGGLGKRIGMSGLFKASVFIMGASYGMWLLLAAYGWLVVFAAVLGLGYGTRIALVPGVLIEFFGLRHLGAMLGIFFTASGVAAVVGPLLAGFIVDRGGSAEWGIAFALVTGMLGFLVLLPLRIDAARGNDPAAEVRTS
ncbi:MAG TPA: MFS transporter [Acetobacteraceae bacterium]|nr:MFS transporter [Acetobacteraceae bacterium]